MLLKYTINTKLLTKKISKFLIYKNLYYIKKNINIKSHNNNYFNMLSYIFIILYL